MRLQEIIVAVTLTLALQMLTLPPDAERMFAVAKGESAAAPHVVVCVMRNRDEAGGNRFYDINALRKRECK